MKKLFLILLLAQCFLSVFSIDDGSDRLWLKGIEYLKDKDYLRGVEAMSEYITKNPSSSYAYHNRGFGKLRMGDVDGSCSDLNKAYSLGFAKSDKLRASLCNDDYLAQRLKKHYYAYTDLNPQKDYRPYYSRKDTLRGMLRPERNCFDVTYYKLAISINPKRKSISGSNKIHFRILERTKKIQLDLFENMHIDSITWNSTQLIFSREYDAVWIDFPQVLEQNTLDSIQVYYHGQPHVARKPPWDGGFVWSRDKFFRNWVGVSCEQIGASLWWPNKDHLSDKPDSVTISLEVPERYTAVSNGSLVSNKIVSKKRNKFTWHINYPINNYNLTFYMGKYVEFTDTISSEEGSLVARYHVLPHNLQKAKSHFQQVHDIIPFYNKAFGFFPFPKDNFRMVESPYQGMEHQTAIAYGNTFTNKKNSSHYINKNYDYIIIHEAAHEWWGNAVSVGDMADAWIHEGFATYAEYMFLENQLGYMAALRELQNNMRIIYNFWPMVHNRDVNEDTFASGDIYMKGSTMLNCLRSTLDNDTLFFQMIYNYQMDHRFKIVDSKGFVDYVNAYFNQDFSALLSKYLYDKNLPVLEYSYKREGEDILLKYKWTEVSERFFMPFSVHFGSDKALRLEATNQEQEVLLKNTNTFNFYNQSSDLKNIPHNSLTYFWTRNVGE